MKQLHYLLWITLFIISGAAHAAQTMEVHHAWVREAPPNATMLAAYLELSNHSNSSRTLLKVTSPKFGAVQLTAPPSTSTPPCEKATAPCPATWAITTWETWAVWATWGTTTCPWASITIPINHLQP
jgi:hypothetical protein